MVDAFKVFHIVVKSKGETELYHTYSPTSSLLLSAFYQVKASASYTSSSEMNLILALMSRFSQRGDYGLSLRGVWWLGRTDALAALGRTRLPSQQASHTRGDSFKMGCYHRVR